MIYTNHLTLFYSPYFSSTTVWLGLSVILIVVNIFILRNKSRVTFTAWSDFFIQIIKKPFIFLALLYFLYVIYSATILFIPEVYFKKLVIVNTVNEDILAGGQLVAFYWLMLNMLNLGEKKLTRWLNATNHKIAVIILPMISNSLKATGILLMINLLIPTLGLKGNIYLIVEKSAKIALIIILAWLVVEFINSLEKFILNQYQIEKSLANLNARKVSTQVHILKKIILGFVIVVTVAAILMVFDSVKNLGAGILTTAGLLSAVGAFASQQSLSRIFAGLQIAFTEPLRLGDTIIINNEFGQIEEITLSFLVVKLWDLRRLILPTDYITTHGLINLTRTSTEILGTIFIYVDYTIPILPLRKEFEQIVADSPRWNRQVAILQVTEAKEFTLELRALVSANDASILWDLRCEIREKLVNYIVKNYPHCLPMIRIIIPSPTNMGEGGAA